MGVAVSYERGNPATLGGGAGWGRTRQQASGAPYATSLFRAADAELRKAPARLDSMCNMTGYSNMDWYHTAVGQDQTAGMWRCAAVPRRARI